MSTVNVRDILSPSATFEQRYVPNLEELALLARKFKDVGYRIGIVGGVWDLIHEGHAKYLELAKKECDILIVVVDSDELVRDRKGPSRPVVPETERLRMISFIRSVDIITLRTLQNHREDKEYLNKAVDPDVCVLSTSTGDIPPEQRKVIEQYCGRIVVFPPQAETSSSARIRLLAVDGATPLAQSVMELVDQRTKAVADLLHSLPTEIKTLVDVHLSKLQGAE